MEKLCRLDSGVTTLRATVPLRPGTQSMGKEHILLFEATEIVRLSVSILMDRITKS